MKLKSLTTTLLSILEPLTLLCIIYAFWFHSPSLPDQLLRDKLLWLLWLAVPLFWLRLVLYNRLVINTPINHFLVILILLTAFNFAHAPFHRENYLIVMSRPLLGLWIYAYFVEHAYIQQRLHWLLIATVGMGLILGCLTLTTTQWEMNKSADLAFIINRIPRFDWRAVEWSPLPASLHFPIKLPPVRDMLLAFNPNEAAGALAFLVPVAAALAVGDPNHSSETSYNILWGVMRVVAGIAFVLLLLSLFLGQSRFAIAGTLGALAIVAIALIRLGSGKLLALSGIVLLTLIQVGLVLNIFAPAPSSDTMGLSGRDQNTLALRFELWDSAFRMMRDAPLTGSGMAMFRTAVRQDAYKIEHYEQQNSAPPHAHNEWLQMGADLGVPGFLLYLIWQGIVLWMLWQGWRSRRRDAQIVAVAVFAGLLAHGVYAVGDAVTLWDRFSFILWWLVGLTGAQYIVAIHNNAQPDLNE